MSSPTSLSPSSNNLLPQVQLIDQFSHPKKQLDSQTYRVVYRDMSKTLTQEECNTLHARIEELAVTSLGVTIR